MVKALFFDIDGTLVSFNTHSIPASTVMALELAKANGVDIYISTGRPYPLINNLGQIQHLIDGYITTNGAYCFIGDEVISCNPIPDDDVRYVIDKSRDWGYPCMVVGEKELTMYNTASNPQIVSHISKLLNVPVIESERPIDEILSGKSCNSLPLLMKNRKRHCWHPCEESNRDAGVPTLPISQPKESAKPRA